MEATASRNYLIGQHCMRHEDVRFYNHLPTYSLSFPLHGLFNPLSRDMAKVAATAAAHAFEVMMQQVR
jgi:hypothetical protein